MPAKLCLDIDSKQSILAAHCRFYNSRVKEPAAYQKYIFNYEDIVKVHREKLEKICLVLNVDFEEDMLKVHRSYSESSVSHSMKKLSRHIDALSLKKWRLGDQAFFRKVKCQTIDTARRVSYSYNEPYLKGTSFMSRVVIYLFLQNINARGEQTKRGPV